MGFCAVMAPARDVSRLTAGLGSEYEFGKTTIKIYPTCRFAHGPIDAALTLKRKHGIDPSKIESVLVETFRQSIEVSDRPELRTLFDAVVSHQYSVALALVNGTVELAAITDEGARDPAVLALMQKVRVVHDPVLEAEFPRSWPHRITVQMTDGAKFSLVSEYPPGRTAPIPRASVDEKFMTLSAPHIGEAKSGEALELLRGLAHSDNVRMLTAALVN